VWVLLVEFKCFRIKEKKAFKAVSCRMFVKSWSEAFFL
jgi:hypothetical protein